MVNQRSPTPPFANGGAIPPAFMHCVYLLQSNKDKSYYIGYTSDLRLRYQDHQEGKVESTKNRRPLQLIYYEAYSSKDLAQKREENLKRFGSAYKALLKRLDLK